MPLFHNDCGGGGCEACAYEDSKKKPAVFEYRKGDIFESGADVLVCPVNCVGVMGKGLALEFKKRFPEQSDLYMKYCEDGHLEPGGVFTTQRLVFAATKDHWRNPSQIDWVKECLNNLAYAVEDLKAETVAIPALGCGLGGLSWDVVRPLYEDILGFNYGRETLHDITILIYEPE